MTLAVVVTVVTVVTVVNVAVTAMGRRHNARRSSLCRCFGGRQGRTHGDSIMMGGYCKPQ